MFLFVTLLFFSACNKKTDVGQRTLRARSTSFLVEQLKENEFKTDWLSLKADISFKTDKMSDSFKMHIRTRTDSVIWISATYYAVEVARFYITPDSVKFMDRKANQYFIGDIDYINDRFQLDLDFYSLQALIMGNSVGVDDIENLRSYQNDGLYHISSVGKRQMKMADKGKEEKINYDYAQSTAIYPETYKVARLDIKDFKANKSLVAYYKKHANLNGQLFPELYDLKVQADNNIDATVEYLKIQTEGPQKFSFTIPEKYEKIN